MVGSLLANLHGQERTAATTEGWPNGIPGFCFPLRHLSKSGKFLTCSPVGVSNVLILQQRGSVERSGKLNHLF